MGVETRHGSLWVETAPPGRDYPVLPGGEEFDVAILGGGIAGLLTALLLKEAGRRVAVIEADRIGRGVTAHSTVKVTAGHGTRYSELERSFGLDTARVYAQANAGGLETIASLVDRLGIDCEFERRSNHVWAETAEERERLEREVAVEREVGLPTSLLDRAEELPFEITGLLRMEDQAQFHPAKFLAGLAAAVDGEGSAVFERSRATKVGEEDRDCRVEAGDGAVRASHVVVATHYPFLNRGFFFAKLYPHREYAVAMRAGSPAGAIRGMYINLGSPTRSMRGAADERGDLLVVVGEGHKAGEASPTDDRYVALEDWGRAHFDAGPPEYRWSTQDPMTMDGLPYVGRIGRTSDRVWVATGFGTWGMTNAAAAADILRERILGNDHPWAATFDAHRVTPRQSALTFTRENAKVAGHLVGDRLRSLAASAADLAPGEGRVVRRGLHAVAVARDDEGRVHAVSAACTHLGCLVAWNAAERSWDCPCHGSRFGIDGRVLHAPAVEPLESLDAADLGLD
jgi:glycine/D-amino acid oxidase-like deaminating enzyme/nitrite reductase/ring-hydroxylating ferredoxin subunit